MMIYFDETKQADDSKPRYYLQRKEGWMPLPHAIEETFLAWEKEAIEQKMGPQYGTVFGGSSHKILRQDFTVCIRVTYEGDIHHCMLKLASGEDGELYWGEQKPTHKGHYYYHQQPPAVEPLLPVHYFERNSPQMSFEGVFTNLSDIRCPPSGLWCTILSGDTVLFQGAVPRATGIDVTGMLLFKSHGLKFNIHTLAPLETIIIEENETGSMLRTTYNKYREATAFVSRENKFGLRMRFFMMMDE